MDYQQKYIKYKMKYNNLKNQFGGLGTEPCQLKEVFDLDCFIPLTTDLENDYIFNKRLSKETINLIRDNIQNYYPNFYNYMVYPNDSLIYLKNEDLQNISIPIISNKQKGIVDYNLMAQKLLNNNIVDYINNLIEINLIQKDLNILVDELIYFFNTTPELNILITSEEIKSVDIESLENFKNIYQIPNQSLGTDFLYKVNNSSRDIRDRMIDLWDIYQTKQKYIIEKRNYISEKRNYITKLINKNNTFNTLKDLIYFNPDIYKEKIKTDYISQDFVKELFENKKSNAIAQILKKFTENPKLNCQIINIGLKFFDSNQSSLIEGLGHANSLIIYRFKKDNIDSYLCLRTEPHRHSNIYCRNSVRKAIRDILKTLPNSYYLDYIINTKTGLQVDEQKNEEIERDNLTDFITLSPKFQSLSPLQGNSGFCASWTIYTTFVLLLNRETELEKLGNYFTTFNYKIDYVSKSQKFLEEFNKCIYGQECKRPKSDFITDVKQYTEYTKTEKGISYVYPYEKDVYQSDMYILIKHIKLYRMILYILYFVTHILKDTSLIDNIINDNDKNILIELFDKFNNLNSNNPIKEKLIESSQVEIQISNDLLNEILNKDTHKCDDNLFEHKDFCLENDIEKPFPNPDIWNCNMSKYKDKDKIILNGLQSSKLIEEEEEYKKGSSKDNLDPIIDYIFDNNL